MSKLLDKDHPLHFLTKSGPKPQPLTDGMKEAWLIAYAKHGVRIAACRATKIPYRQIKSAEKEDPDFAEAMSLAKDIHTDTLEEAALERAYGIEEDVFYQGEAVGKKLVGSDRLMELFLKARRPKVYNDKLQLEAKVEGGVLVVPAVAATTQQWLKDTDEDDE